jgi:hypothetical protein
MAAALSNKVVAGGTGTSAFGNDGDAGIAENVHISGEADLV